MRDQRLAYSCGREQGAGSLPFHVPGTVVQLNEFSLPLDLDRSKIANLGSFSIIQ